MDLQPTLRGTLVELRPLQASDWDALYAVAADPLIWEQHPERTRHQEAVFREFFRGALESKGALVAIDRQTQRVIGSSRYAGYDPTLREVEIGWTFLARDHWGGRFNGEMKQLMLQYAFQFVDRVVFVIGAQNTRSITAVERLGARRLATHAACEPGCVVYGLSQDTASLATS